MRSAVARQAQTAAVAAAEADVEPNAVSLMNSNRSPSRRRALRLYMVGQTLVVAGAGLMSWMHSLLPMALAGSAALMMTVPLVRDIAVARRVRR